ncbi:hypothetical protein MJ561_03870 [Klebsiella pneumoniae]|nr:hypothetical protein MJ561_03870 [Klebsiella pneumoniae]
MHPPGGGGAVENPRGRQLRNRAGGDVFLTNVDTRFLHQKQGHGALVSTPEGEWYYASLCARPWNRPRNPSTTRAAGPTLGREAAIKKVYWGR